MKKLFVFSMLLLTLQVKVYAWNNLGHRVIAQIAYDNMDKRSQRLFTEYNQLLNVKGRRFTLVDSAIWMDTLYSDKYKGFRKLHYIDIPLIVGKVKKKPKLDSYNIVFAINMASLILQDKQANPLDKALAFRILWHVVGDIHQPMHAVSRYSKRFPYGDKGGNLVKLRKNRIAKNLHQYWDRGAGILFIKKYLNAKEVASLAKEIATEYPCDKSFVQVDPDAWAKESHNIAVNYAYSFPINSSYQESTQNISKKRIALAACRLAAMSDRLSAR